MLINKFANLANTIPLQVKQVIPSNLKIVKITIGYYRRGLLEKNKEYG